MELHHAGLAAICKEGVDAIGKTLKELELAGYIIRRQLRGKDGRISDTEYTIFEKPRKPSPPDTTLPDTETRIWITWIRRHRIRIIPRN